MKIQKSEIDFTGERFFIGIDVHKTNWKVTIINSQIELQTFSMEPSPEKLAAHLKNNYPGGEYFTVYEAGFSGYWIDRKLKKLGIKNIIVNPGDIPTKNKEKTIKTDTIDSRKLARELSNGTISSIYIPDEIHEQLRSLCRLRYQITKTQSRLKNQIKGMLYFYGMQLPEKYRVNNWSGEFIRYLESLKFSYNIGDDCLNVYLEQFKTNQKRIAEIIKLLKKHTLAYGVEQTIKNLCSIPGISFITAITLFTEIININRFKRLDELSSYVGLVPAVRSSGERERTLGISNRHNRFLRNLLIEAAWVAVRKDPALTMCYGELIKRMKKQKAIIKIAKKLLNRVRYVWKNNQRYEIAVVA
jgi:transposase